VNYSEEISFWGVSTGIFKDVSTLLCELFVNLRAIYVFAITMAVGMELLQCYEQVCTEFKVTWLYGSSSSRPVVSDLTQFSHRFVKLQRMFDIYQSIGGDYALITVVNCASDFIYYVYSFTRNSDIEWDAVSWLGILESVLILFCFAFLGNCLEDKVTFLAFKDSGTPNNILCNILTCLILDEGNEKRAT
jgi:hypothetical protein